jgi:hypothetical protein
MSLSTKIRALLREHHDGMVLSQIAEAVDKSQSTTWKSIKTMPDAYVDRWIRQQTGPKHHVAVWCVVVPPANCPKPTE